MALKFHEGGHNLLLHCNQSTEVAEALAATLNSRRQDSAHVVALDLTQIDKLDVFANKYLSQTDRLVALINNASAFYPTPLSEVTATQFDELINVNLRAPYFLAKTFAAQLAGGSIINFVDIYAEKLVKDFSAYSMSKAGLAMMTRSPAQELAPDVRVNGISPGAILWPEGSEFTNAAAMGVLAEIPAGDLGDPTDIANAALFLVDRAHYVTGQIILVDGGSSI